MNHCRGWERRKADLTPSHPAPCPCVTRLRPPGAAGPGAAAAAAAAADDDDKDDDRGCHGCPETFLSLRPHGSRGLFLFAAEPRSAGHLGSEITYTFFLFCFLGKAHHEPIRIAKALVLKLEDFCSFYLFSAVNIWVYLQRQDVQ